MISITYVSSAVFPFNETTLLDLVGQCQRNNERLGVTGKPRLSGDPVPSSIRRRPVISGQSLMPLAGLAAHRTARRVNRVSLRNGAPLCGST